MAKDPKELQHKLAEADKATLAAPRPPEMAKAINDLSEVHMRKLEWPAPGSNVRQLKPARVKVTHVSSGLVVIESGVNRHEAKLKAYAELARQLGMVGAAAAYTDAAMQAVKDYDEKLRRETDGDF